MGLWFDFFKSVFYFLPVAEIKLRALHLLDRYLRHTSSPFCFSYALHRLSLL
jgi:hypothetical protein